MTARKDCMKLRKGYNRTIFACIALLFAAVLASCTPADNNGTDNLTGTPSVSATPTPVFRDSVDKNVRAKAVELVPTFLGERDEVWNLAKEYTIEKTRAGEGETVGWFRFLWQEDAVYVLVHVTDDTPDTQAESVFERDSVFVYINEDGRKNLRYTVGDAFYAVDRDGRGFLGRGGTENAFYTCTYPDETGEGYYAQFRIPLLSVTGRYDREIGFDVCINNAADGVLVQSIQWADTSGYTEVTMTGVGTVRMD